MSSNPSSSNTCPNQNQYSKQLSGEMSPVNELERSASGEQVADGSLQETSGGNRARSGFETSSLMKEVENTERDVDDTKSPAVSPPQGSVEGVGANVVPPQPSLLSFLMNRNLTPNPVSHSIYPPNSKFPFRKSSYPSHFGGIVRYFSARAQFKPVNRTVGQLKDLEGHPHTAHVGVVFSKEKVSVTSKDEINKKKNDEEDGGLSQTSKHNRKHSSSKHSKRGRNPSSKMDKRTGSLKLDTVVNEAEGGAQDMKILKSGSYQMDSCPNQKEVTKKTHQTQLKENSPHKKRAPRKEEEEASGAGFVGDAGGNCSQSQETKKSQAARKRKRKIQKLNSRSRKPPSSNLEKYPFLERNPMETIKHPFRKAIINLGNCNFLRAALFFEVALRTRQVPRGSLFSAWSGLGFCRVQTEHHHLAIPALKQYLKLIENDLDVLILLVFLYVFENCENLAMVTLWQWLKKHPVHNDIEVSPPPEDMKNVTSPLNLDFHHKLLEGFLWAVYKNPFGKIDTTVQWGLGLLYNMTHDYEKSEECFKKILQMDRSDEIAWNFLGRTRMETKNYTEALEAYNMALSLKPKCSRTRYNMGLTYSKMGNHEEALNQFLQGLNKRPRYGKEIHCRLDASLWSGLKLELCYLGRSDLEEAANNRNLQLLNKKIKNIN